MGQHTQRAHFSLNKKPIHFCRETGKLKYPSKAAAKKRLREQQQHNASVCRVYQCDMCKGFHLTSSEDYTQGAKHGHRVRKHKPRLKGNFYFKID
jgi:hypothetical protein